MNLENVIYKLRRALDTRINQLSISITSGGVGQINAYEAVKQELSNLLNDKEQDEGNVVDINSKNSPTK